MEINKTTLWTKNWLEKKNLPHSFFKVTNSTNDLAKQKTFPSHFKNHIFLTNKQTKGRGQGFKKWKDSDLMITWLWEDVSIPIHSKLSEEFILELLKSVKKIWPNLPWELKKPNDLYLENKKIAGLLLEILDQSSKKTFILGLGFNVFSHPKLSQSKTPQMRSPNLKDLPTNPLQAGHLEEYTDVSKKHWELFLDELHKLWAKKILNTISK